MKERCDVGAVLGEIDVHVLGRKLDVVAKCVKPVIGLERDGLPSGVSFAFRRSRRNWEASALLETGAMMLDDSVAQMSGQKIRRAV
jgi:hypothetical protein